MLVVWVTGRPFVVLVVFEAGPMRLTLGGTKSTELLKRCDRCQTHWPWLQISNPTICINFRQKTQVSFRWTALYTPLGAALSNESTKRRPSEWWCVASTIYLIAFQLIHPCWRLTHHTDLCRCQTFCPSTWKYVQNCTWTAYDAHGGQLQFQTR